ncbi:MAG: hypothetical protein HYV97_09625 [Bdellovibrio sp.]|nr:hypothetical protein [Bdellovibrio sp.]
MKVIVGILFLTISFRTLADCQVVGSYNYHTKYNKEDGLWEICRDLNQDFFKFTYNGKVKTVKLEYLEKKIEYLHQAVEAATKNQKGPINQSQVGCGSRWEFFITIDQGRKIEQQRGCLTHKTEAYQAFRLHFHSWYGESEI